MKSAIRNYTGKAPAGQEVEEEEKEIINDDTPIEKQKNKAQEQQLEALTNVVGKPKKNSK